jgi:hypothetical protein
MIRFSLPLAAGAAAMLSTGGALGQDGDETFDRTPQRCIIVSSIDQTEAVDDQTIIFHMRGRAVFRNQLPRECPGLERENRIAYETRTSRLCSSDTITVLEDAGVGGFDRLGGLRRGFTCRLGEFMPMSPADVEELELRQEGRGEQRAIETQSIELPEDEEAPTDEAAEPDEADAADTDD